MPRVFWLIILLSAPPVWAQSPAKNDPPPIEDNSFLLEEAYNQEAGVVQHISALAWDDKDNWVYTFTQEWPLGGQLHQLSFTVPVQQSGGSLGSATGVGDVGLNYRHQLISPVASPLAFAPRITLNLPTGDEDDGSGAGSVGFQANLPLSITLSRRLVGHYNAGLTLVPSAKNFSGDEATTVDFNLGTSLIWLARPWLNVLMEGLWLSAESPTASGSIREEDLFLNPGVRAAINAGSLQIVPGMAYTIGLGPSEGNEAWFFYLSFEHPFKKQ